jgi:hypothetical protein
MYLFKALFSSAETKPTTPNSKQCRCRSMVARKNSLERQEPRKKPREEPGSEGWPVLFWLCQMEIYKSTWPLSLDHSSRCSNVHR